MSTQAKKKAGRKKTGISNKKISESDRLRELMQNACVDEKIIEALEATIDNVAWMKERLDKTRKAIANTDVAIPYDNGGGQMGIRENPLYKGYESLFKAYMAGMRVIFDALPKKVEAQERKQIDRPKTVLELVRAKHTA